MTEEYDSIGNENEIIELAEDDDSENASVTKYETISDAGMVASTISMTSARKRNTVSSVTRKARIARKLKRKKEKQEEYDRFLAQNV